MSQDIDNNEKTEPGFSNKNPGKENQRLPLVINGVIFGIYSLGILANVLLSKNDGYLSGPLIGYAFFISAQVILNLLIFLVYCFIDIKKGGLFLLSAVLVLLIGFSVCGGIGSISEKLNSNKKDNSSQDTASSKNEKAGSDTLKKIDSITPLKQIDSVH